MAGSGAQALLQTAGKAEALKQKLSDSRLGKGRLGRRLWAAPCKWFPAGPECVLIPQESTEGARAQPLEAQPLGR